MTESADSVNDEGMPAAESMNRLAVQVRMGAEGVAIAEAIMAEGRRSALLAEAASPMAERLEGQLRRFESALANAKRLHHARALRYRDMQGGLQTLPDWTELSRLQSNRFWGVTRDEIARQLSQCHNDAEAFLSEVTSIIARSMRNPKS